jgi:SAM-dependent methyltransferase
MAAMTDEQRTRTLARFEDHRRVWDNNPGLRRLYAEWYGRVAAELPAPSLGPRVELGSGPGFARQFIPDLELSDIVRAPWHDREVSADALPFGDASLGAIVLFDVLHHLPAPRRFFAEANRALRPGGRVVMCEPYMSPLSYLVYKFLHVEPVTLRVDPLDPAAPAASGATRDPFDSNQAIPSLLFGRGRRAFAEAFPALAIRSIGYFSGFSYPASGGFSRRAWLPRPIRWALHAIESRLPKVIFRLMGFRMLVVLEKRT